MNRLRPGPSVLGGAALGLIAGAAVYTAVTTASGATSTPVSFKAAQVRVALAPPPAAPCGAGQTLEKGSCIVHVTRVVKVTKVLVRQGPAVSQAAAPTQRSSAGYRYRGAQLPPYQPTGRGPAESDHESGTDD